MEKFCDRKKNVLRKSPILYTYNNNLVNESSHAVRLHFESIMHAYKGLDRSIIDALKFFCLYLYVFKHQKTIQKVNFYFSVQWAAVRSHSLLMRAAPHMIMPSVIMTCHGHEWAFASLPPIIRPTNSNGLLKATPQSVWHKQEVRKHLIECSV